MSKDFNSRIQYQNMRLLQHILLPKGVLFIQEELKMESPPLHLIIRIPTITLKDGANHVVVIKVIIHTVDLILPLIYVDDILITSSTTQVFQFIKHLNNNFALRDLDRYLPILQTRRAFQYLMITHPDLSFEVNKACQFMAQPTTDTSLSSNESLGTLEMGICLFAASISSPGPH
ncbi:hypothetical protein AAG906_022505 [Vitis piasezkii]